jgi:hypothetical protein
VRHDDAVVEVANQVAVRHHHTLGGTRRTCQGYDRVIES